MKCKYCGCELEEGLRFCPDCGSILDDSVEDVMEPAVEPITEPDTLEEAVADTTEEATEEAAEATGEEAQAPAEPEAKPAGNKNPLLIATIVISSIAIILLSILLWRQANPKADEKTPEAPAAAEAGTDAAASTTVGHLFTLDGADLTDEVLNKVIATCGDVTLTNDNLPYYYWDSFNSMSYYLSYYGINVYGNLDDEVISEGVTLGDYMLDYTLYYFNMYAGLYTDAKKAGFTMNEEFQSSLDNLRTDMEEYALNSGYESLDAYILEQYGPTASFEGYYAYEEVYLTAMGYWEYLCDSHEVSDEELDSYWQENQATLAESGIERIDLPNVNVRHILLMPGDIQLSEGEEGYDAEKQAVWDAAKAQADEIYQQWQKGDATEDSFAELANEHSQDPGSNTTGGLYEDVYPGQMVQSFNDWCFDSSRAVGDTAIVETDYGYHIMYFSGVTDTIYWKSYVREQLIQAYSGELQTDLSARYTVDSDTTAALLYAANIRG